MEHADQMHGRQIGEDRYPALFSHTYLELVVELGYSIEPLLRRAGITLAEAHSERGLRYSQYDSLLDEILAVFGNTGIGLDMGWRLPPTAYGSLGQAILASATLGDAIRLCERFWQLFGMGMSFGMQCLDQQCVLTYQPLPLIPRRQWPLVLESTLASMHRGFAILQPALLAQGEVWFGFAEPVYVAKALQQLGRVRYGMPANQLRFPALLLDTPLAMANPVGLRAAVAQCAEQERLRGSPGVSGRVQRELVRSGDCYPNLEQVARRLHMTPRTLRRRLGEEGTSFQALLSTARRHEAMRLLENSALEIGQVGQMLGYADPANFTRAFRQLAGLTPSQYRALVDGPETG